MSGRSNPINLGFVTASKGARSVPMILEEFHARGLKTRTGKRLSKLYTKGMMPDEVYSEPLGGDLADETAGRADLGRLGASEPNADALLPLAESVLSNPVELWQESETALRWSFRVCFFPKGSPTRLVERGISRGASR